MIILRYDRFFIVLWTAHNNLISKTAHNLYLVFDLCTGGELFDRICAKGNYYEA